MMIGRKFLSAGLTAAVLVSAGAADARTQIRAVGSSTVYPFATAVAERFVQGGRSGGSPVIESTGTGAGLKLFCAGVGERFPDLANASRRIKSGEVKTCAANGVRQITEVQVGLDGIALATSKRSPLTGVTQRDVYMALAKAPFGKPNKARTWKDVNPKLPALPIKVYGPPSTSGTRDALGELLMTPPCEAAPAIAAMKKSDEAKFKAICTGIREDGAYVEAGENDNLIVQKIEATPGTIGIFGYSYLEENTNLLKGLAINGVVPTYETISTFKYPGARPLYVYVKNAHVRAIPAIRGFLAEFTKETTWGRQGYLVRRGMIAAPDAVRARAAAAARSLTPLDPGSIK
jgi:phosphate transport system substrate-binding protein